VTSTAPTGTAPVLAVTPVEAAALLGMSRDSFDRYVKSEVRVVRRGRLVLVPVRELEKWVERNAALTLEGER
jgi:excisionase family DNA binding protein